MLYHFQIELSDVDRGVYEKLSFRILQHPSESGSYLLSRALAYGLSYREYLEFSPNGLGDPDTPALWQKGLTGNLELWIEIGNPSARKLHKASKAAAQVIVYTYKNPELLVSEILDNRVHRGREIQIFAFDPKFLIELEGHLKKGNHWSLLLQNGQFDIGVTDQGQTTCLVSEVRRVAFR